MAITNVQVYTRALRKLNVLSEIDTPSSEQGETCRVSLNQMMAEWREMRGVKIGYFSQPDTTGNCPIPEWAEGAVIASLAARVAPEFGAEVSMELAAQISSTYRGLQRKLQNEALDNVDMSHLPIGQGHIGSGLYDINTDS